MYTTPAARSLPDAMGLLLPADAPYEWPAAVDRAAQLLADHWGRDKRISEAELGTLAFAVYALGYELQLPAALVPLADIEAALSDRTGPDSDTRHRLSDRVRGALKADSQYPDFSDFRRFRSTDLHKTALAALCDSLTYQWEATAPGEPSSDHPPHPAPNQGRAPHLLHVLAQLDTAAALPDPPRPTGPLTVHVTGTVHTVTEHATGGASLPVRCATCGTQENGALLADGPAGHYECTNGHQTTSDRLTAVQIRNAVAHLGVKAGRDLPTEGRITVEGDLLIAATDMPDAWEPIDRFGRGR